ncbi:hypothetical protein FRB90_000668 [Tulasnella sp. 427]|nr:hypothetical protein FRB90_000668 [Tulasnella sp. 427]
MSSETRRDLGTDAQKSTKAPIQLQLADTEAEQTFLQHESQQRRVEAARRPSLPIGQLANISPFHTSHLSLKLLDHIISTTFRRLDVFRMAKFGAGQARKKAPTAQQNKPKKSADRDKKKSSNKKAQKNKRAL